MATLVSPEQAAIRNGRLARDDNVLAQKILQIVRHKLTISSAIDTFLFVLR